VQQSAFDQDQQGWNPTRLRSLGGSESWRRWDCHGAPFRQGEPGRTVLLELIGSVRLIVHGVHYAHVRMQCKNTKKEAGLTFEARMRVQMSAETAWAVEPF
jgi:hypothetical protein